MAKLIGITMRVIENETYPEQRNAISIDWHKYLEGILPNVVLIPLINQSHRIIKIVRELKLDGIILSNGNDWGEATERDRTEEKLIEYCSRNEIPLLGVCRGMQVLNIFFKGELEKNICKNEDHVNSIHEITLQCRSFIKISQYEQIVVNSFHNQGFHREKVSKSFIPFAQTATGVVEGICHRNKPIIGIQWHPERSNPAEAFDKKLIRKFFKCGKFW